MMFPFFVCTLEWNHIFQAVFLSDLSCDNMQICRLALGSAVFLFSQVDAPILEPKSNTPDVFLTACCTRNKVFIGIKHLPSNNVKMKVYIEKPFKHGSLLVVTVHGWGRIWRGQG